MTRLVAAFFIFLGLHGTALAARSDKADSQRFDLSRIGLVVDGKQMCEDKGRLQDYPSREMDRIIAAGPKAVPSLIGLITDGQLAKTQEPIICYWPGMAIGDIAFCLLSDLFTDSSYTKSTLPGSSWDELLGPAENRPGWDQLYDFIQKHGRARLQSKWRSLWDTYGARMYWDEEERCFKLRNA